MIIITAQDSANNNTNSNSPAYNSYYSAQQDNSSATLYNSNDVSASNSTSNQTEYAAPNTASSYTDANNSTQENAFVKQDALSLTNSSAATADYNVSPYNGTDNSSSPLASDTRYSDQQSAGYTYSEQALAPAQTPSPAQSPYPAYAPSPAPYPAPYSYPAPYPSPYPAPAYAPYPAPAPYPYPAYAPYSYPSSYPAPAQAPSPAPAEVKNETKSSCQLERQMAKTMDDAFVPECKEDGSYGDMQCFEHEGFAKQCWCVTSDGQEIRGSRMSDGQTPDCAKIVAAEEKKDEKEKENHHDEPVTTKEETQMNTTEKLPDQGGKTYEVEIQMFKNDTEKPKTQCQKEREISLSPFITDIFVPVCDEDGKFVPLQCFEHDVYGKQCWCVDLSGQEIQGTRTENGTTLECGTVHANITTVPSCNLGPYGCCHDNETFAKGPDMEGCPPQQDQHLTPLASPVSPPVLSQCQKDQQNAKNSGAADIFVPECEPSGLFKEVQCYSYPASGKTDCWCVNQNTGSEITGTRVTGLTPNCRGFAKDVCGSLLLGQVWYEQLTDKSNAMAYLRQLSKEISQGIVGVYKGVHPAFKSARLTAVRKTKNPYMKNGPYIINLFFVISFKKAVADPLATLRDHLVSKKVLNKHQCIPQSLHLIGPFHPKTKCPPKGYQPLPGPKPVHPPAKPPVLQPSPKPPVVKPPPPKPSPAPQPVKPPVVPHPTKPNPQVGLPVAALLALHLPFDRHSGIDVLDTSSKANNGKINNVDITNLPQGCGLVGLFSHGNVSFNGRKFFPKPSVAVTIAMWVKLTSTAGRQSLFDTIATGAKQGNYHFEVVDGKVRWFARDINGKDVFNVNTAQVVVPPNQWTHLVGTYDKQEGVARVYVNTQPAASANGAGYLAQDWGERAGIGSHKGDRFIVGAVDEVYIYTSALTQTQIRHLACVCEDSKGISKFP
nr:uncharacterized protein LOC131774625 [Pocillopora verrucosa]